MIIFLKQRKKTKKKYTQTTKNAIYQVIIKTNIKNYNKNIAETKQKRIFANAKSKIWQCLRSSAGRAIDS